jgi:hypothetical protein
MGSHYGSAAYDPSDCTGKHYKSEKRCWDRSFLADEPEQFGQYAKSPREVQSSIE